VPKITVTTDDGTFIGKVEIKEGAVLTVADVQSITDMVDDAISVESAKKHREEFDAKGGFKPPSR